MRHTDFLYQFIVQNIMLTVVDKCLITMHEL
jgi:hypothetical protein